MRVSSYGRYATFVVLVIAAVLTGCTAVGPESTVGIMGLSLQIPPTSPETGPIESVVLRIQPSEGGEFTEYVLDVVDNTASSEIEVAPGSWNLEAQVFGGGGLLLAEGSGYAVVLPGAVTEVNLYLHSVTGGLEIDIEWEDGPPLYIADVSYRPVWVDIAGKGVFYASGLSRIGWDIQVFEYPTHDGHIIKEPGELSYPDLAMVGLEGSPDDVARLAEWSPGDEPRTMTIILEGRAGEMLRLNFFEAILVDSNPEITATGEYPYYDRMGGVRVSYLKFELDTYTPPFRDPGPEFLAVYPGQKVEINGEPMYPSYAPGVLDAPLPGENAQFWIPSLPEAQVAYDWGAETLDVLDEYNAVIRRNVDIINFDEFGDEIDRDTMFEVWPASINLFNPEKPYGETFLVDMYLVGEWVEDR